MISIAEKGSFAFCACLSFAKISQKVNSPFLGD